MKFKDFMRKSFLKPWDIGIIAFLIIISFTPILIFSFQQQESGDASHYAVLRVDGKEIKSFDLVAGEKSYTYKYEDPDGDYNLIKIDGERIRITEANCGDQVCVRQGWISKSGQTIVCLPHKLVIEVQASDGSEEDGMIY